jgi:hypothetical protein
MINALQTWKAANKQPVNVIIGAMAASAASALSIMAGTKISAFKNSKMMFHGAATYTEGGQGAHTDNAELIGKINADIMAVLTTRYNMNPDTVAGWFAEGRAGWLNAQEMKAAGIIETIEDADDNVIEFDAGSMAEMDGKGLQIAAMLENETDQETGETDKPEEGNTDEGETTEGDKDAGAGTDEGGEKPVEDGGKVPAAAAAVTVAPVVDVAALVASAVTDALGEQLEAVQAMQARLETADKNLRAMQASRDRLEVELKAEREKAQATISNVQEALNKANGRISRFLNAATTFSPEPQDWLEALKQCGGNHAEASRRFGHLRAAYNEQQKQKREGKR